MRLNNRSIWVKLQFYEGLSDVQIESLNANGLPAGYLGNGSAIGRFGKDGGVMVPNMSTAVVFLGA